MFKALERVMAGILIATIAWHATNGKRGLILSIAGRKGKTHFSCITSVVKVFMRNVGINPAGELLIDDVDEVQDIRNMKNLKDISGFLLGNVRMKKLAYPMISGFFLVV